MQNYFMKLYQEKESSEEELDIIAELAVIKIEIMDQIDCEHKGVIKKVILI